MVRQESNNTQADLADLRGARFVMTSETEEGQRLSQGKLKRITQGMGKIKATRKYENPIEFPETHKLWMDTNSQADRSGRRTTRPPSTGCIRSRSRSRFPPRRSTRACRGNCWRKPRASSRGPWKAPRLGASNGLGKPPEVAAANDDWRCRERPTRTFHRGVLRGGGVAQRERRARCTSATASGPRAPGENAITETLFGRRLKDRGFSKEHRRYGTVYTGIALRARRLRRKGVTGLPCDGL